MRKTLVLLATTDVMVQAPHAYGFVWELTTPDGTTRRVSGANMTKALAKRVDETLDEAGILEGETVYASRYVTDEDLTALLQAAV